MAGAVGRRNEVGMSCFCWSGLLLAVTLMAMLYPFGQPAAQPSPAPASIQPYTEKSAARSVDLDVALTDDGEGLIGRALIRLRNDSDRPLDSIPLFLYPNTLAQPEPDLSDVTWPFRFPGGFSAGGMALSHLEVDGRTVALPDRFTEWLEVPLPHPIGVGDEVRLQLEYTVSIPHRYGLFGRIDGQIVMEGGWYPVIPRLAAGGFDRSCISQPAPTRVQLRSPHLGLAVIGQKASRIASRQRLEFSPQWSAGLLFWFSPRGCVRLGFAKGQPVVLAGAHGQQDECRNSSGRLARVIDLLLENRFGPAQSQREEVGQDTAPSPTSDAPQTPRRPPFLALQAPLREVLTYPIPNGILFSDHLFNVTPAASLLHHHTEAVRTARIAGQMLACPLTTLRDALLAINVFAFQDWESGRADPANVREMFMQAEVIGALDTIGTDPQAGFESTMFFNPRLPGELARTPTFAVSPCPAPRSMARLLLLGLGVQPVRQAIVAALSCQQGFIDHLRAQTSGPNRSILEAILSYGELDVWLESVERNPQGWTVQVCKSQARPIPVEMKVGRGAATLRQVALCPHACCPVRLPASPVPPDILLDPLGILQQTDPDGSQDPRRNDRNYVDLKWMLSRPFFTWSRGDPFPTVGLQLELQPRWDLRNVGVVQPLLTPSRAVIQAGWRHAFGTAVRPNFLSDSIQIGLRTSTAIESGLASTLGPAFTYVHRTRQSRFNPFQGTYHFAYLYPIVALNNGELGARLGGMMSAVAGSSPDHVVAGRLQVDSAVGWVPQWEHAYAGGSEGIRALATADLRSRHRLGATVEYRFMLMRNRALSFLDLIWLSGLQVALFGDVATVANELDRLGSSPSWYLDAGIGLRPTFQAFGLFPAMASIDLAWLIPLSEGQTAVMGFLIGFIQPL